MLTFDPAVLRGFVAELWRALGVPDPDAETVATALVEANLCGHDSHGVIRVAQWVAHLREGLLVAGAPITVVRESPAMVVIDGGWNFGALVATKAVALAKAKARSVGIGVATIRRSHHIGRLSDYCLQAAEAGCIAAIVANNHGQAAAVAPWGGRERRLATNPMAYGFPRAAAPPIIVDVTTSVAPEGKIRVLRARGEEAPAGWLLDAAGFPTVDPNAFYDEPRGSILPLGGEVGHKGYGLSVAVELLGGALSGGGCTRAVPPPCYGNATTITLYDVATFAPEGDYHEFVEQFVRDLKDCPRQSGVQEILLPGEPEHRTAQRRRREGIPIDEATWATLRALAEELAVVAPVGRRGVEHEDA